MKAAWIGAGAAILALGYGYGVYRGYVHVNGTAAGKYPVRGIDVSHYQGEIDWEMVAGQGIDFAYVKATEGSSHVDGKFVQNMDGARAAGMPAGAYHFFSFDSPGASQAENFMAAAGNFEGMMVPVVDVEFYGDKRADPPDGEVVEVQLKDFLDRVEAACGRKPVIYATREAWEIYVQGRFEEYPLWIRDIWREPVLGHGTEAGQRVIPGDREMDEAEAGSGALQSAGEGNWRGVVPEGEIVNEWKGWTFWQYTNRGRLDGVSGEEEFVDLNVFFGTRKQWEEWLGE